jgi:serine/threonine protein kinase/Tfp pilus assembly protein PilF
MTDRPGDQDPTLASGPAAGDEDRTIPSSGSAPAASDPTLPTEIGGYRIFGRLGEGGMGVVYEAEQPSPRRRVALKVVRGSEHLDELRFRMFEREAATLARLHHPGIGGVYASGRTAEGRQFFAMELVRGPTLDEWLASRPTRPDRAEITRRLRLFAQICAAVHYAHQRGVIHRDLKPSNLIVTEEGDGSDGATADSIPTVKILDFGLARVTEDDAAEADVTEVGTVKGTLAYMAPEQAQGDSAAVDVRTDVYALGVILYELLTGARPYTVDPSSLLASVRIICEQPPRNLAEAWTATEKLDPDLATVVATALAKNVEERYASAAAFGEDVGRLLSSQPILARPPSTMYQLRKLIARRKPVFATAAAALLLLLVAAVGIGVLYVQSEQNLSRALLAERSARLEAQTAQRTADFMVELFDQANPVNTGGRTMTVREVVDAGAQRLQSGLADEPVMKARLLATIAGVYKSLGLFDDARRLADQSHDLRTEHLPADDVAIADSDLLQAGILDATGDREAARDAFDRAIRAYEALGPEGTSGLVNALGDKAWMLGVVGDFAGANDAIDRALALATSTDPPDDLRRLRLLSNRATILMNQGAVDSALTVLNRALATSRDLVGDDDETTATILTNIGVANAMAGQMDRSTEPYVEALRIYRKVYGENHPMVARALGNVGINYAQLGQLNQAMPYMQQALDAHVAIYGPDSPRLGQAYMNLGLAKLQLGDAAAAEPDLQRAVELNERAATDSTSISLSFSLYHLASARAELGDTDAARRLMQRVIAMDTRIFGASSEEVAGDLEDLAILERSVGNEAEAARLEQQARQIRATTTNEAAAAESADAEHGRTEDD